MPRSVARIILPGLESLFPPDIQVVNVFLNSVDDSYGFTGGWLAESK
jgi:hypothetical protein